LRGFDCRLCAKRANGPAQGVRTAGDPFRIACRYRSFQFCQPPGVFREKYSNHLVQQLSIIILAF
jgi:hypothetical protein